MNPNTHPRPAGGVLTSHFICDEAIRSRTVSHTVLAGTIDIPASPPRLVADWAREISSHLDLGPGDVEQMPLARARARWPDYAHCVGAVSDWAAARGLPGLLASSDIALMACRGARYHHDGEQYGDAAFCNLFLSDDREQDVHFPALGLRIPLRRGTVLLFDTCQPHGVIRRGGHGFRAADFPVARDCAQLFLTWELPIHDARVIEALGITFDVAPLPAPDQDEAQLLLDGARASLCPDTGGWIVGG